MAVDRSRPVTAGLPAELAADSAPASPLTAGGTGRSDPPLTAGGEMFGAVSAELRLRVPRRRSSNELPERELPMSGRGLTVAGRGTTVPGCAIAGPDRFGRVDAGFVAGTPDATSAALEDPPEVAGTPDDRSELPAGDLRFALGLRNGSVRDDGLEESRSVLLPGREPDGAAPLTVGPEVPGVDRIAELPVVRDGRLPTPDSPPLLLPLSRPEGRPIPVTALDRDGCPIPLELLGLLPISIPPRLPGVNAPSLLLELPDRLDDAAGAEIRGVDETDGGADGRDDCTPLLRGTKPPRGVLPADAEEDPFPESCGPAINTPLSNKADISPITQTVPVQL